MVRLAVGVATSRMDAVKIGTVDVGATAKTTVKEFLQHDLQGASAEVAYHLLFSVVPLLIFLTALSGFVTRAIGVNDAMGSITDWLFTESGLPPEAARALEEPIRGVVENEAGGFLSLGAVLALWGGKNAIGSMMKALNVAFDVKETRPWWKKTAVAIGLTIALGLGVVVASSAFLAGSFVGEELAGVLGLGDAWTTTWSILRWVLIPIVLILALSCLYWAGPNVGGSWRWLTPGSVLSILLAGIATFGLSIYFQYFAGYLETYGILGAVLAFVFWLYVMSVIVLFGGELNSILARKHDPAAREDMADPEKRRRPPEPPSQATADMGARPSVLPAFPNLAHLATAERAARQALADESPRGEARRFKTALTTLGAALLAAISSIIVGARRR